MCRIGQYILDLGGGSAFYDLYESGRFPEEDVISVDFNPEAKQKFPDKVIFTDFDLRGLPLCDNSCRFIRARDVLEHCRNLTFVMNECYRVLCHGGIMEIKGPSEGSQGAWGNPDHCRCVNCYTIEHFRKPIPNSGLATWFEIKSCQDDGTWLFAEMRAIKEKQVPEFVANINPF